MTLVASPLVTRLRKAMVEDPIATSFLIDLATDEWIAQQERLVGDEVIKAFCEAALPHLRQAKRTLGRAYVEKMVEGTYPGDQYLKQAEWLSGLMVMIEDFGKADTDRNGRQRTAAQRAADEERSRRMKGGAAIRVNNRFAGSHAWSTTAESDAEGVAPEDLAPGIADLIGPNGAQLSPEQKKARDRHQFQWASVNNHLMNASQALGKDAKNVRAKITVVKPDSSIQHVEIASLADVSNGLTESLPKVNSLSDTIASVEFVAPDDASPRVKAKVASYNSLGYARPDSAIPLTLRRLAGSDWQSAFGPGDVNESGLTNFFNRMTAGASVLNALPGQDKYADWARFVGDLGPQADTALGPHVRRAAYRYRGTEKTPDPELRADFSTKGRSPYAGVLALAASDASSDEVKEVAGRMPSGQNPVIDAFQRAARRGATGDQLRLQVASDVAARHLATTLPPDPFMAKLSEKAGHILPSQGVLFDAKGDLVSQAVGASDDHYLPFDLRNIARARGGQYVRTRVQGGLTGEDVYALIQSGARQATVVSGSGVFTLELDPTFRGARGNSDKARSMYTRYLQILDAVEASGLYLQDVPAAVRNRLKAEAERSVIPSNDKAADAERVKTIYEQKLDRMRRDMGSLDDTELEQLQSEAESEVLSDPRTKAMSRPQIARLIDDVYDDKVEAARADKVQSLRLNAAGYDMALKTLQQQFPYFIRRVNYTSLKDVSGAAGVLAREQSSDTGYVRPGGLRADSTRSGFYNPTTSQQPKKPRKGEKVEEKTEEKKPAATTAATPAAPSGAGATTPQGRLHSALAANAVGARGQAEGALGKLAAMLSQMPDPDAKAAPLIGAPLPAGASKDTVAQWALVNLWSGAPARSILEQPEAIAALTEPKNVTAGMNRLWPGATDFEDKIKGGDYNAADFGGETTAEGVHRWIAEQVQSIADADSSMNPHAGTYEEGYDPFAAGSKPRMDPEMDATTPQELQQYVDSPKGKAAMDFAVSRGWINGQKMAAAPVVAKDVHDMLRTLKLAQEAWESIASSGNPDILQDPVKHVVTNLDRATGGKGGEQLAAAFGGTMPSRDAFANGDMRVAADQIQRAWSLFGTMVAVRSLGGEGGPPFGVPLPPKAEQQGASKALDPSLDLDLEDPVAVASLLRSVGIRA